MFSGILLRMEYRKLLDRRDKITERLKTEEVTNELLIEMKNLERDVNYLNKKINDECRRLGLN